MALVLAHLVDRHDVRVVQGGGRLGLGAEAGDVDRGRQNAFEDHLQRHDSVEARLPRLVHDSHAAPCDLFQEFVVAEVADRGHRAGIRSRRRDSSRRRSAATVRRGGRCGRSRRRRHGAARPARDDGRAVPGGWAPAPASTACRYSAMTRSRWLNDSVASFGVVMGHSLDSSSRLRSASPRRRSDATAGTVRPMWSAIRWSVQP